MLARTLEPEVMDGPAEAAAYERMDHSAVNEAFVQRLIELGAHGHLLDLGTGPGDIPIALARRLHGIQITAVDLAEPMLELARRKVAAAGLDRRISVARADAKALLYPKASFAGVFSNTILHHLPEPLAMLKEVKRVLDTRGVLLIRDLMRPASAAEVEALVTQHAGYDPRHQQLLRQSLHAALTPAELRRLADEAGLKHVEVTVDSDRHMSLQRHAG